MLTYIAVAVGLVAALNLPVIVAARALALAATARAERRCEELGDERRARLEAYVRER